MNKLNESNAPYNTTNPKRKKLIAIGLIAALVASVTAGAFLQIQSAIAQQNPGVPSNSPQSTHSGTDKSQDRDQDKEKALRHGLLQEIRSHANNIRGFNVHAGSLVDDIRVVGVVKGADDTLAVTLAFVPDKPKETSASSPSATNTPSTESSTAPGIYVVAQSENKNTGKKMFGEASVPGGWTGSTTISIKMHGGGDLMVSQWLRVVALPEHDAPKGS